VFRKILFPIDFSQVSERVLSYVLSLADKYGSEIYIVHVTRDLTYFTELDIPYPSIYSFNQDIRQGAERKMDEFCATHLSGRKVVCQVLDGDPGAEILNFIDKNEIDLVIMGSHGRTGLNRIFFGSVAARVTRNSPVPVMTIRPLQALAKQSKGQAPPV
jgi:nucleotide-binding universal stress UspA family protein